MTTFDVVDESGSKDRVVPRRHGTRKSPATGRHGGSNVAAGQRTAEKAVENDSSTEKGDSGTEASAVETANSVGVDKGKSIDRPPETTKADQAVEVPSSDSAGSGPVVENTTDQVTSVPKVAQTPDVDPSYQIMKFDWVPDPVAARLSAAVAWQKPHRSVYTLSSVVPAAATFGSYKNKFLNYKGKLLTIAFVARLMGGSFREDEGDPARCGSVTFKFVRDIDDLVCRTLLYGKAKPPEHDPRKTFWAGAQQTVYEKGIQLSDLAVFDEVYDGSQKVTTTNKMPKLDCSELSSNDLVLMECQIRRWTPGSERYVGAQWSTRLRLVRVVRLFKAPAYVPPDPVEVRETQEKEEEPESDDDAMGF